MKYPRVLEQDSNNKNLQNGGLGGEEGVELRLPEGDTLIFLQDAIVCRDCAAYVGHQGNLHGS